MQDSVVNCIEGGAAQAFPVLNDGKTEFNSGDLCQLPLTISNPSTITEHAVNFEATVLGSFPQGKTEGILKNIVITINPTMFFAESSFPHLVGAFEGDPMQDILVNFQSNWNQSEPIIMLVNNDIHGLWNNLATAVESFSEIENQLNSLDEQNLAPQWTQFMSQLGSIHTLNVRNPQLNILQLNIQLCDSFAELQPQNIVDSLSKITDPVWKDSVSEESLSNLIHNIDEVIDRLNCINSDHKKCLQIALSPNFEYPEASDSDSSDLESDDSGQGQEENDSSSAKSDDKMPTLEDSKPDAKRPRKG